MGIEDNASKGLFSKTTSLKHKSTIFTIGKRGEILNQQLEAPIIVPHAQLKNRVSNSLLVIMICVFSYKMYLTYSTPLKLYSVPNSMPLSTMPVESIYL